MSVAHFTPTVNMHTEKLHKNDQNVMYTVKNTHLFFKYFLIGVRICGFEITEKR